MDGFGNLDGPFAGCTGPFASRRIASLRLSLPAGLEWIELAPGAARQGRGSRCVPTPSDLCSGPGSQFHEARSLCQSRHAVKAAVIPTAAPTATSNATIIAMIATKAVSVIEVRPCLCALTSGPACTRLEEP